MNINNLQHICIFAGTYEGRTLVNHFCNHSINITACVATEYGEILLEECHHIAILQGRMDYPQMCSFFKNNTFDLVIDATHPFAREVTQNIKNACTFANLEYLRLIRDSANFSADVLCSSMAEAIDYLAKTTGNIFLTTGSKDLHRFAANPQLKDRLYVRVLPALESLAECQRLGIKSSHIMAVQGPFSRTHNQAAFEWANARYVVTKDSGKTGGLNEKLLAAKDAKAATVVISRPADEQGLSLNKVIQTIESRIKPLALPQIQIIGIGPGDATLLTDAGRTAIQECDCLLGAKRLLSFADTYRKSAYPIFAPLEVKNFLEQHPQFQKVVLLVSGDSGFFSNAKKLISALSPSDIGIIPGISSIVYFAAQIKTTWADGKFVSLHGRTEDFAAIVHCSPKTFFLLGGKENIATFSQRLLAYNLASVTITLGEQLSYDDECITTGTPSFFTTYQSQPLSVVMVENPHPRTIGAIGVSDDAFIRGNVPMTKEEVRILSIAKLQLQTDSCLYDIGAGTGSISIEVGRAFPHCKVFAIEQKEAGLELISKNSSIFGTDNVKPIKGVAPAAFLNLPLPTHAFIGGSGGYMKEILTALIELNPNIRIVINLITLESLSEIMTISRQLAFKTFEVISVTTARSKKAGRYHLMEGQNPIYIITCQGIKNNKGELSDAE